MAISKINKQKRENMCTIQIKENEAVYLRVGRHGRIAGRCWGEMRQGDSKVIPFQVKTYKQYLKIKYETKKREHLIYTKLSALGGGKTHRKCMC